MVSSTTLATYIRPIYPICATITPRFLDLDVMMSTSRQTMNELYRVTRRAIECNQAQVAKGHVNSIIVSFFLDKRWVEIQKRALIA
jgi:hypothetical protein